MAPVKIKLSNHYKGDSWVGMVIGPVLINGAQPIQTLASARMHFRDNVSGVLGQALSTAGGAGIGTITILDNVTWEIDVPAQLIDLIAGKWDWDFEITDSLGTVLTLYKGTMTVKEDVTYE